MGDDKVKNRRTEIRSRGVEDERGRRERREVTSVTQTQEKGREEEVRVAHEKRTLLVGVDCLYSSWYAPFVVDNIISYMYT